MPVNRFETPPDDSPETSGDDEPLHGGPEAIERLRGQLEELGEYARLYISARVDARLATIRTVSLWLLARGTVLLVLVAVATAGAVIGLLGVTELVGRVLGDRQGVGFVVTGFGCLAFCWAALLTGFHTLRTTYRNETVNRYAKRHATQRARFGRDVTGRPASQAERS